jgi:hypothetical protein
MNNELDAMWKEDILENKHLEDQEGDGEII